jgi:hypothetical protein
MNTDGRIIVTNPGVGVVRLPGGVDVMHRGIFPFTTVQQDFNTDPSTTYHLRWNPTNGFRLIKLTDAAYNPTGLVETNVLFDSTYDSMLVARVIMNSSNTATITNLLNKNRAYFNGSVSGPGYIINTGGTNDGVQYDGSFSLNWARSPYVHVDGVAAQTSAPVLHGYANYALVDTVSRYGVAAHVSSDFYSTVIPQYNPWGRLNLMAFL